MLFVNSVNMKQVLLCEMQQISPISVSYLLQGSAATHVMAEPVEGPHVPTGPAGAHICSGASCYTYGKNFLGTCRCMMVVVL